MSATPVTLPADLASPLRLVGAWQLDAPRSQFGGWSGLVEDGDRLVLIGDRGTWMKMRAPVRGRAGVQQLPATLGWIDFAPFRWPYNFERDSEAIAADPRGRGWWVAIERNHRIVLFDPDFRRARLIHLVRKPVMAENRGLEGLAIDRGKLVLAPEWHQTHDALWVGGVTRQVPRDIAPAPGVTSDVAAANGAIWLLRRQITPLGIRSYLAAADGGRAPIRLPNGWLDNMEGVSIVGRPDGSARLWLISDDNFSPAMRTLLIALDAPPGWLPATRRVADGRTR